MQLSFYINVVKREKKRGRKERDEKKIWNESRAKSFLKIDIYNFGPFLSILVNILKGV